MREQRQTPSMATKSSVTTATTRTLLTSSTQTHPHNGRRSNLSRLVIHAALVLLIITTQTICVHATPTAINITDTSAAPSDRLTSSPTSSPTAKPSMGEDSEDSQPTPSPTEPMPLIQFTENGITMILNGVEPLHPDGVDWFKAQTKRYIEEYYNIFTENLNPQRRYLKEEQHERKVDVDSAIINYQLKGQERQLKELQSLVYDATVEVDVIEMDPPYAASRKVRRRMTEGDDTSIASNGESRLQITYDQQMTYRNNTMDIDQVTNDKYVLLDKETIANLIQEPFNTFTRRDTYIQYLKDPTGPANVIPIFEHLKTVGPPELNDDDDGQGGISTTVIIAAAAGGGAFLIVSTILFICWRRKRGGKGHKMSDDSRVYNATHPRTSNGASNGNRYPGLDDDGGSTLVDPPPAGGVFNPDGSLKDYGHTPSIGTMDYDYINGNAAASIVSSAGGTLGSRTMQSTKFSGHSQMMGISAMSGMIGANGQESSIFDPNDEQSFEQHMYSSRQGQHKEEIIEVYAPAGKLGVVIDTPNSGAPVVYNIKDTCPIADKLRVGDKLIAVDNEDVRSMTAPKVSKLISQKSKNRTRKFTVMRAIS